MKLSRTPCRRGKPPVPSVAWNGAVVEGDEPTVACVYLVLFARRAFRLGHTLGHRFST